MRKILIVLSTLVIASLLLAACAAERETPTSAPTEPLMTDAPTEEATIEPAGTGTVEPSTESTPGAGIPVTGEEDPSRISNQLDYDVWNQNGEQIGEVDDMVIDLGDTRVSYVIVGTGGFLEIGEREILVPWDSLELSTEGGDLTGGDQFAFILLADQELFENAPDVDVNAILPSFGEPAGDWDAEIRNFWEGGIVPSTGTPSTDGTTVPEATATVSLDGTPVPETTASPDVVPTGELQGVILATELLGSTITVGADGTVTDIQGPLPVQGTPVPPGTAVATAMPEATATLSTAPGTTVGTTTATVDDVLVDIDSGDILFIVISVAFDDGERWIPVPLDQFSWDAANGFLILNVDQVKLEGAPFFENGEFPDTSVEGWDAEFLTFWQGAGMGTGAQSTATP